MLRTITDRWLVEQFLLFRSERAFSKLYDRHSSSLFYIALQITDGRHDVAEDLLQTTWMKVVLKLNTFRWESSLRTWIVGILINSGKEYFRNHRKGSTIELSPDDPSAVHISLDKIDLEKVIAEMPAGYKTVFVLHDIEGFKHLEISDLLGINEGTSKSQLFHARKMLKKYLLN